MTRLKKELVIRPECLLAVAPVGLDSTEYEARWQIADALGTVELSAEIVGPLLVRFCEDENEYVRRRALLALGRRKSDQAEALARRSWDSGHERQQMAALDVLWNLGSPLLPQYLEEAERDPRQYLSVAAKRYRVRE